MKKTVKKIANKIYKKIITDKKIIIASLSVGLVASLSVSLYTKAYSETIQADIASKVIRFHVLANSNTEVDQSLKLKVRDGIILDFKEELENCTDVEQSRKIIIKNLQNIEETANEIIRENGFDYIAKASLENIDFPTKHYGNISFPPGEYEALRIEIGSGDGDNWWCVMFPPLCFVDITQGKDIKNTKPSSENSNSYTKYLENDFIEKKYDFIENEVVQASIVNNKRISEQKNMFQAEDYKTDDYETKDFETEDYKAENYETEDYETGYFETGDYKKDNYKTKDYEAGDYNTGDYETENYEPKDYEADNYKTNKKQTEQTSTFETENYKTDINQTEEKKGTISKKSKEILKNTLKEDEYNLVTNDDKDEIGQVKIKFKIVEFWQNMKINKNLYISR